MKSSRLCACYVFSVPRVQRNTHRSIRMPTKLITFRHTLIHSSLLAGDGSKVARGRRTEERDCQKSRRKKVRFCQ